MKYQAESNAVHEILFDLEDLVDNENSRFEPNQKIEIIRLKNKANYYLSKRLPLKAKRQARLLDRYIQECLYQY